MPPTVLALVQSAIAELNQQLPPNQRLGSEATAALSGAVDSLGLINLVVAVEQRVEDAFDLELGLTDALVNADPAALATVGSFATLVGRLVEESGHGRR